MLTDNHRNQYMRYKRDTSTFLSWLSVTSKHCGYHFPTESEPTTGNRTLKIPLKCIPEMSKAVAESGKTVLQIPASIAATARRAVSTRRSFSKELQKQGPLRVNKASDSSHEHFCCKLEECLDALEASPPQPVAIPVAEQNASTSFLSNRFQGLQVEDTQDKRPNDLSATPPSRSSQEKVDQTFEVVDESEQQLERLVILHDFLLELYEVGENVSRLWKQYSESKIELDTTALFTSAALVLVVEKEKEIAQTLGIPENHLWEKLKQDGPKDQKSRMCTEAKDKTKYFGFLYFVEVILWKFWKHFDPSRTTVYIENQSVGMAKTIPTLGSVLPVVSWATPHVEYATENPYSIRQQTPFACMVENRPDIAENFSSPGVDQDRLFKATNKHHGGTTCSDCLLTETELLQRQPRSDSFSRVHFGTIGSANIVAKDGVFRDQLREDFNVLCVEMEAGGIQESLPGLIIRGISDYADSHKNDNWQPYAAAMAAAYMKALLLNIPRPDAAHGIFPAAEKIRCPTIIRNDPLSRPKLDQILKRQADNFGMKLNWGKSIVDLLKLLIRTMIWKPGMLLRQG